MKLGRWNVHLLNVVHTIQPLINGIIHVVPFRDLLTYFRTYLRHSLKLILEVQEK